MAKSVSMSARTCSELGWRDGDAFGSARVCGAKRPTWNPRFEAYVTALRSATKNAPRDVGLLRAATSVSVPGPLLPAGVLRCTERLARPDGSELAVEFVWPRAATPMAELSRKWSTTSAQTTPDVVRTTEIRELLDTALERCRAMS